MGQSGREEGAEEEQKIDMELKLLSYSQDALAVYRINQGCSALPEYKDVARCLPLLLLYLFHLQ